MQKVANILVKSNAEEQSTRIRTIEYRWCEGSSELAGLEFVNVIDSHDAFQTYD